MNLFEAVSGWLQLTFILGSLAFAWLLTRQFALQEWRWVWIVFGFGFCGMLESRVLVLLFTYGIETAWMRFASRYITPLQVASGLFTGLVLLYRLLHRDSDMHKAIRLPHPAGFVLDRDSRVVSWDQGATDLFGWTATEATGCTIMELIVPPRLTPTHMSVVLRYTQRGQTEEPSETFALRARYRDTPQVFPVEVILSAVLASDGVTQFRGIARRLFPL